MPSKTSLKSRLLSLSVASTLLIPLGLCAPAQAATTSDESTVEQELKAAVANPSSVQGEERVELFDDAAEVIGEDALDAQLGQGAKRIAENGDPTIPTVSELAQLSGKIAEDDSASLKVSTPASVEDLITWRAPGVQGIDVSHHNGVIDWKKAKRSGIEFAYIKASESSTFKDSRFSANYSGATAAGILRGAYHFALPAHSSGKQQATHFLANGGNWTADGKTLPPLMDLEWNPYSAKVYPEGKGDICYGLTPAQMVNWIKDFGNTVKAKTGRLPMIYTAQSWWDDCTGDSTAFKNWPLHVSLYPAANGVPKNPRELPEGWTTFNMWQYSSNSNLLGSGTTTDANVWNGDLTSLKDFARNKKSVPYTLSTKYLGNADVVPTRLGPTRMAGANRYGTPVAISKQTFPRGASTVVIASGENFPDALSATPLATLHNAPLLLTKKGSLPSEVAAEVKRLKPKSIIVVGGPTAVTTKVTNALKKYAPVSRTAGNNRYGTSSMVASKWKSANTVYVATGRSFADALSMAAAAAGDKAPMLLSSKKSVDSQIIKQLKRLNPTRVYIAGGPLAVNKTAEAQIRKAAPRAKIIRYGGANRYETSALIAKKFWTKGSQRQFIANGSSFPDGLTGSVTAAYNGAPLLLAKKTCLPASVASSFKAMEGWTNVLVGGPLVLDNTVAYRNNGRINSCS